jgi:hypothetical protein
MVDTDTKQDSPAPSRRRLVTVEFIEPSTGAKHGDGTVSIFDGVETRIYHVKDGKADVPAAEMAQVLSRFEGSRIADQ